MLMRPKPIARQSSASSSFWRGFATAFAAPMLFWCSFRSIAESSPAPDMKGAWAEAGKAMQGGAEDAGFLKYQHFEPKSARFW